MKYILFTYDAITAIMADRRLQSVDFKEGIELCRFLTKESAEWSHWKIISSPDKNGVILHTDKIDKQQGLLFDLSTFHGFEEEKGDLKKISNIIIKVLRYAVKYFENILYTSQNERYIKANNITLVYPYQFIRNVEVPKVVIDCNNWKEASRKSLRFLTAYDYQRGERQDISYTNLSKAVTALQNISIKDKKCATVEFPKIPYTVTGLSSIATPLSPSIGSEDWDYYLSEPQKAFVNRPINGPERLEGAAGSGKTLSMCLRIIKSLLTAEQEDRCLNLIYFTHSNSTKESIIDILNNNCRDFERFLEGNQGRPKHSVKVCTLQEWCSEHLGINDLSDDEYLDKDAGDSKLCQLLHIEDAWEKSYSRYFSIMKDDLSGEFRSFLEGTPKPVLFEILQREISEIIKGQAKAKLDTYIKISRPRFALTLSNESDRRFVFNVFDDYQQTLNRLGQFDSDDIVITALGQVDAPIWNRRRSSEGYDACFIDETHLFNLNEISIFHYINKPDKRNNIIFCIDRAQSVGDAYRADTQLVIDENGNEVRPFVESLSTLFRSSPDVAALAYSILTSGAAMFTTLENPLQSFSSVTDEKSRLSKMPVLYQKPSTDDCIKTAIDWAQNYCNVTGCPRNHVLIISTDEAILDSLKKYVDGMHKPHVILNGRRDQANIKKAINDNRFVIGSIDFVGGLEFDAVVIVGVDANRVPPIELSAGHHIINFAWFNRLYVAVTRAKYAVALFGESLSGVSPLIEGAIKDGTLLVDPDK